MRISDWSSDVCSSDLVIFGRAGAGEADFDFFEADADEQVEEARLLLGIHRVDQRLVAVAHVGGEPDRRLGGDAGGPFAVRARNLRKGAIFDRGVAEHGRGFGFFFGWLRWVSIGTLSGGPRLAGSHGHGKGAGTVRR